MQIHLGNMIVILWINIDRMIYELYNESNTLLNKYNMIDQVKMEAREGIAMAKD